LKQERGWISREATRKERHEELKQNLVACFKDEVTAPYIPDNMTSTFVGQLSELI